MHTRTRILLLIVSGIGACTAPLRASAQPALSGEATLVNAPGPRAVAAGGASVVFGPEALDVTLQPALLAHARTFELGLAIERDRFPLRDAELWSVAVRLPLQTLDPHLPGLAVVHRRLRAVAAAEGSLLGVERRLELDYATDATTLAAGWSLGAPAHSRAGWGGSLGGALHVLESGGSLRAASFGSTGDTTLTVTPGLEDLLFAGSIGAIGRWSVPVGTTGSVQLRAGAVWRRAGEESDALATTLRLTNLDPASLALLGIDGSRLAGPLMASELAFGTGVRVRRAPVEFTLQGEVVRGVHAGAVEREFWRWGGSVRLFDVVELRGGGVDDLRLDDLVGGVGVELPLRARWRLGIDLAFEPTRFPAADLDDTVVWGLRLTGPLPTGSDEDRPDESLEDVLDGIDAWLDGEASPDDGADDGADDGPGDGADDGPGDGAHP